MCLKIFVEILKVQNVVWIFGWVVCFIAFISVFFPYWKTIFKQSRYLAICWALKLFLIAILTNPRQLGGSIGKVPRPSIASRQLVDRSSFCSWSGTFVPRYLLDTCICRRAFPRHLPRQMARHLSRPLSFENYWGSIHSFFAIQFSFLQSLSICSHLFISQTLSSHSYLVPQGFFKLFQFFSSLGKLLISHSSCISCFET